MIIQRHMSYCNEVSDGIGCICATPYICDRCGVPPSLTGCARKNCEAKPNPLFGKKEMPNYLYANERHKLFTEEGLELVLRVRDNAKRLLAEAGAARWDKLVAGGNGGDSWTMLAAVDYLVERLELREVTGPNVAGQDRVFVRGLK